MTTVPISTRMVPIVSEDELHSTIGAAPMFNRIEALVAKKDILEARIEQESSRPQPDALRLQLLKRLRLRLKDNIVRAQHVADRLAALDLSARDSLRSTG